jgi:hypothetical protein
VGNKILDRTIRKITLLLPVFSALLAYHSRCLAKIFEAIQPACKKVEEFIEGPRVHTIILVASPEKSCVKNGNV